jgi:hypothetical protein
MTPRIADVVAAGAYPQPSDLSPRDIAVRFFSPLASRLDSGDTAFPVALPFWSALPPAMRRPLERTALTLGAALQPARIGLELIPATTLAGDHPASILGPAYVAPEPVLYLPGGPPPPAYGAGAFRPGVNLLVGDRSNVARIGQLKHRLPFVTFAGTGVGPWLNQQLEAAGVREDELYWINAYDAAGAATDPAVIKALQPRKVIALGKLAERWLIDAGMPHAAVILSPSEWRQEFKREPYPVGRIIREGMQ